MENSALRCNCVINCVVGSFTKVITWWIWDEWLLFLWNSGFFAGRTLMWLNYSAFSGPLEKKASSLGRYHEWRSEPQFWVLIPSPSPDVSKLQRERENRCLRGTGRKEKSHSGWHWILLENFGYTWLYCWSMMMPAEVSFCVAKDCMKGQEWTSLRRQCLSCAQRHM